MLDLIIMLPRPIFSYFFFSTDTATTDIYTLSLHDALPIWRQKQPHARYRSPVLHGRRTRDRRHARKQDRKSTRLNSSHVRISYAVFCLKKKKGDAQRPGERARR